MPVTTSKSLANTYQTHFSRKLLGHAVQELVLDQFGQAGDLPKNTGSKTIRWFAPGVADASAVQTLQEGVPISTFREIKYEHTEATLSQYGEATKITDVASMTALFDALKQSIQSMGEDCALFADSHVRTVLSLPTGGLMKRYAGGAADFDALKAKSNADGKLTAQDILDAVTQLQVNRAPKLGAGYVCVVCPQVQRDLIRDSDLLDPAKYQKEDRIAKNEIGMVWGARIVFHTNPQKEDEVEGTHTDTFDPATGTNKTGFIYSTYVLGRDAYGVPKLAGTQSPYRPQVIINNKPDKSDPLNQFITAGWKSYWAAKVLKHRWGITLRSKATWKASTL